MSTTTTTIVNRKIYVDVTVINPVNVSISKSYKALVDTGSQETLISPQVIADIGLVALPNFVNIADAQGQVVKSYRHHCIVNLNGHKKGIVLYCPTLIRKDMDVIIGMDIIETIQMCISNQTLTITS